MDVPPPPVGLLNEVAAHQQLFDVFDEVVRALCWWVCAQGQLPVATTPEYAGQPFDLPGNTHLGFLKARSADSHLPPTIRRRWDATGSVSA